MQGMLILLAVALALLAVVLSAVLLFRNRNLTMRLEGMLNEVEEIRATQRRVLEQFHGIAHRQKILTEKIAGKVAAKTADAKEPPVLDSKAVKEDVLFLSRQGLSAERIARDLSIPRGEVELILDLAKFRAED